MSEKARIYSREAERLRPRSGKALRRMSSEAGMLSSVGDALLVTRAGPPEGCRENCGGTKPHTSTTTASYRPVESAAGVSGGLRNVAVACVSPERRSRDSENPMPLLQARRATTHE